MPGAVICRICLRAFPRPRAYRRHQCSGLRLSSAPTAATELPLASAPAPGPSTARDASSPSPIGSAAGGLVPGTTTVSPPVSSSATSSLQPGATSTPPFVLELHAPSSTIKDTSPREIGPPASASVGVQVDGDWHPAARVRRHLFASNTPMLRLRAIDLPGWREHFEIDHALRLDIDARRPQCDCATCVDHATAVAYLRDQSAEIPRARGVRYITAPGVNLRPSTSRARERLTQRLRQRPEKTLLVCACRPCTLHRNLIGAWLKARALQNSDAPR